MTVSGKRRVIVQVSWFQAAYGNPFLLALDIDIVGFQCLFNDQVGPGVGASEGAR